MKIVGAEETRGVAAVVAGRREPPGPRRLLRGLPLVLVRLVGLGVIGKDGVTRDTAGTASVGAVSCAAVVDVVAVGVLRSLGSRLIPRWISESPSVSWNQVCNTTGVRVCMCTTLHDK